MSWLSAPRSRRLLLGPGLLAAAVALAAPHVFAGTLSNDTGELSVSDAGFQASDEMRERLKAGKVIVEIGRRITARHVRLLEQSGLKRLDVPREYLIDRVIAHPSEA